MSKFCTKCGLEKPIEEFGKLNQSKDGLQHWCKKCINEKSNKWAENHRVKRRETSKRYRDNHKNELGYRVREHSYQRKSREKNKEGINQRQRDHYNKIKDDEEFKQRNNEKVKRYVINNSDKVKSYQQRYRIENRLGLLEDKRKYYDNIRLEILYYYSNGTMRCKCGEYHVEFLEIDHINGGGNRHKREENISNMYQYLIGKNFPDGVQVLCSNCNTKKVKVDARERSERGRKSQKYSYTYSQKLKNDIFSNYMVSGKIKCSCPNCNVDDIDVLCLDHVGGWGSEHRKSTGINGGLTMYRWIKNNNYPDTFRVLCHNCNQSLGKYEYCPHDGGE